MTTHPPLRILPLPDLGGIEVARSVEARMHYPRHIEATFSIGAIEAGGLRAFHRGRVHLMPAGCVGIVGPEEVHTSDPADRAGSWSARGFYPRAEQVASVASDLAGRRVPTPRFPETVVRDGALWTAIRSACIAAEQGAPALAREALLHRAQAHPPHHRAAAQQPGLPAFGARNNPPATLAVRRRYAPPPGQRGGRSNDALISNSEHRRGAGQPRRTGS